jgi:TrmH family RNA methyltransferase
MIQKISSLQNPGIKNLILLTEKSRVRKQQNIFIIEGEREISRAKASGFRFDSCYYCPEILSQKSHEILNSIENEVKLFEVSQTVYSKIAYRDNVDGLVVTAFMRDSALETLALRNNPLILILETVEKPGNLGAILRTADAAALDAVIICDTQTDLYNPNVIRSSLGCIFSNQVVSCESSEAIAFLKKNGIRIFAAALQNSVLYQYEDYKVGTAFVMGSEADGLTEIWRNEADCIVQIPMAGMADSLNVSVSAAVLVFEAVRQRAKPGSKK